MLRGWDSMMDWFGGPMRPKGASSSHNTFLFRKKLNDFLFILHPLHKHFNLFATVNTLTRFN